MKTRVTLVSMRQSDGESKSTFADYEAYVPEEMFHFIKILEFGAKKYGDRNWLDVNGKKSSEYDMIASMQRHLDSAYLCQLDGETNQDHLLHLATRALMLYTRRQRNIIHEEDELE